MDGWMDGGMHVGVDVVNYTPIAIADGFCSRMSSGCFRNPAAGMLRLHMQ